MQCYLLYLCVLGSLHRVLPQCQTTSEFRLPGDYLLGGLFRIHNIANPVPQERPVSVDCARETFVLAGYLKFQVMRYSVEEINSNIALLPNVTLGYELFDHCSENLNFEEMFNLISNNDSTINNQGDANKYLPKVIGVVGSLLSSYTIAVAPLFMMHLIPMISYGSASSLLSDKSKYPSFLRTIQPNKYFTEAVVKIITNFNWHWVSFLYGGKVYGKESLDVFMKQIVGTNICLGHSDDLDTNSNHFQIFKEIEKLKINVIVVFAFENQAQSLIKSAIKFNISSKVWIASDTWSLDADIPKINGIENIGTVLGITELAVPMPGFKDFIYTTYNNSCLNAQQQSYLNQWCNCSNVTAEDILSASQTYLFNVYSAAYALAYALHNVLQCESGRCLNNITVYPYMVLNEVKKSNFTLLNQIIQFDNNGDPIHTTYEIIYWDSGEQKRVGIYRPLPSVFFSLNQTEIKWQNGTLPVSICSRPCAQGAAMIPDKVQPCCFTCDLCSNGTYLNKTGDSTCTPCKDNEWSPDGSTFCFLRTVEYMSVKDVETLLVAVAVVALLSLTAAIAVLFAIHYNTPVVRSSGGPMTFLILACLGLSSVSVLFYFGKPSGFTCIMRYLPFVLFYTVCSACFAVRSFQIVCVFKLANKFPGFHAWWMKHNGQWMVIAVSFVLQAFLLTVYYAKGPPEPYSNKLWSPDQIVLGCDFGNSEIFSVSVVLFVSLSALCFIFSYMGKELPKNYNEAKTLTFCLLLQAVDWLFFATGYDLYRGKYIYLFNALAVLISLYCILLFYFLPKCYIILFQSQKNTQQYFQGIIQDYTMHK